MKGFIVTVAVAAAIFVAVTGCPQQRERPRVQVAVEYVGHPQ